MISPEEYAKFVTYSLCSECSKLATGSTLFHGKLDTKKLCDRCFYRWKRLNKTTKIDSVIDAEKN